MKKVIGIIGAVLLIVVIGVLIWYTISISRVSKSDEQVEITIPLGSTSDDIANILKENKLIRSKSAFKIYIKLHKVSNFQAGTYYLNKNMNVKDISETLQTGIMFEQDQVKLTYIEGKNIRWLAEKIEEDTNNTKDDVYSLLENEEYIDYLIEKYWFLTDEIKDNDIYYPLEGYLFPETYFFSKDNINVKDIFEKMLDQMDKILQKYKYDIENSNYSVHKILTIASIIEMESMSEEGRRDVSSVIYNRLNNNMAIQSDVTTYYAIKVNMGDRDLYQSEINTYNRYNTRRTQYGREIACRANIFL